MVNSNNAENDFPTKCRILQKVKLAKIFLENRGLVKNADFFPNPQNYRK
jgi:hypothetical protein